MGQTVTEAARGNFCSRKFGSRAVVGKWAPGLRQKGPQSGQSESQPIFGLHLMPHLSCMDHTDDAVAGMNGISLVSCPLPSPKTYERASSLHSSSWLR